MGRTGSKPSKLEYKSIPGCLRDPEKVKVFFDTIGAGGTLAAAYKASGLSGMSSAISVLRRMRDRDQLERFSPIQERMLRAAISRYDKAVAYRPNSRHLDMTEDDVSAVLEVLTA